MSERYINNLTGDFSICFSEHLTEHPIQQSKTQNPHVGLYVKECFAMLKNLRTFAPHFSRHSQGATYFLITI